MLPYQVGKLHGIHAADSGAILVIFLIPTAYAMDNGNALRSRAILEHNIAISWSRGINHPLKLKAGDNIIQSLIAILIDRGRVK